MITEVQDRLKAAVKAVFGVDVTPTVEVPDEQFGDVASNVAMQLAKEVGKNPREIAEQLADTLQELDDFAEVSVAGPGFLNIRLNDEAIWSSSQDYSVQGFALTQPDYDAKNVVLEYACPNWFKELHTGHLYQTILGNALARMLEVAGANVTRTTFGGDVGMHVAKAVWSILKDPEGYAEAQQNDDPQVRARFITQHYVKGTAAFEQGGSDEAEIRELNKQIYAFHTDKSTHSDVSAVYFAAREWSTEYFHYFFDRINVDDFQKYYPESTTAERGMALVRGGLEDGVFEESERAIVYRGEKEGLHTRVFQTSEGLPTYETKDLGVLTQEKEDYDFDRRILITGSDQKAYMKVVWAALYDIDSRYRGTMTHLTNGIVKFADGSKMSSRLGNVTRAIDVLDAVTKVVAQESGSDEKDKVMLGAVKYEFLKYAVGSDVAFDVNESVSTKGNSGPYLQYAYVRARKIALSKTNDDNGEVDIATLSLDEYDRRLAHKLAQYEGVFGEAVEHLAPNTLCLYLYELAQTFNQFYENNRVAGSGIPHRWELLTRYINVLNHGLTTLGIDTPESM